MSTNNYRFRIGEFLCMIVNDGTVVYPNPMENLFANVSPDALAPAFRAHNLDPATWTGHVSPYPSLFIDTGEHRVLVDMGAGKMAPTTGNLLANLREADVDPETIDIVFLTHAHPDHIGGALDELGRPALPKARYVMGQAEWDFWAADPDLKNMQIPDPVRASIRACARETLPRLQEHLELIESGAEILPGLEAFAAPGHTPGQLGLAVSSAGECLLALTDVFLHPIHIDHPQWVALFDYDPVATVATRRLLYERASSEGALVTAGHLPWPCLGYIDKQDDGWRWKPV